MAELTDNKEINERLGIVIKTLCGGYSKYSVHRLTVVLESYLRTVDDEEQNLVMSAMLKQGSVLLCNIMSKIEQAFGVEDVVSHTFVPFDKDSEGLVNNFHACVYLIEKICERFQITQNGCLIEDSEIAENIAVASGYIKEATCGKYQILPVFTPKVFKTSIIVERV